MYYKVIYIYIYWFINIWYLIYSSIYTFLYIVYMSYMRMELVMSKIRLNWNKLQNMMCQMLMLHYSPWQRLQGMKKTLIVGFVFLKHIHNVHSLAFPRKYKFTGCLACVVSCKGCVPCGWWDCFKQCVQHVWHWATKWNPSWI